VTPIPQVAQDGNRVLASNESSIQQHVALIIVARASSRRETFPMT
jgi:hypothetical protein